MNRILRWCFIVPLLVMACTNDRSTAPRVDNDRRKNAVVTSNADQCNACTFGPRTYVRSSATPTTVSSTFSADPAADYIIDIDDDGSVGADESVTLNGVVLLAARISNEVAPRHIRRSVPLLKLNAIKIRQIGKLGSTIRIEIQSGVKSIGVNGGLIKTPEGVILEFPSEALTTETEIKVVIGVGAPDVDASQVQLVSPVITLLPDGLRLLRAAKLIIPINSGINKDKAALYYIPKNEDWLVRNSGGASEFGDTLIGFVTHFSDWQAAVPSTYSAGNYEYAVGAPSKKVRTIAGTVLSKPEGETDIARAVSEWSELLRQSSILFSQHNSSSASIQIYFTDTEIVDQDVAGETLIGKGANKGKRGIRLNDNDFNWFSANELANGPSISQGRRSVQQTVLHEFGHVLGLGHFSSLIKRSYCDGIAKKFQKDPDETCWSPPVMASIGNDEIPTALTVDDFANLIRSTFVVPKFGPAQSLNADESSAPAVQNGFTSEGVAMTPVIVVRDASGKAVPGVTVFFTADHGGTVGPSVATTDADGKAHVLNWTLGSLPGTNTLSATWYKNKGSNEALGSSILFKANAVVQPNCTWCNSTLTFTNNQIPSGWQQATYGPNAATIANQRVEASATDRGLQFRANGTPIAGTKTIEVTTDGPMADIFFGMFNNVQLETGTTAWWVGVSAYTCTSSSGCGPPNGQTNQLVLDAQRLSGYTFPAHATSTTSLNRIAVSYQSGTVLRVTRTFTDGNVAITIRRLSDNALIATQQILLPDFHIADVTGAGFHLYYTSSSTFSPVWLDNVSFQLFN